MAKFAQSEWPKPWDTLLSLFTRTCSHSGRLACTSDGISFGVRLASPAWLPPGPGGKLLRQLPACAVTLAAGCFYFSLSLPLAVLLQDMDARKAELKQLQEQLAAVHKAVKEAETGEQVAHNAMAGA